MSVGAETNEVPEQDSKPQRATNLAGVYAHLSYLGDPSENGGRTGIALCDSSLEVGSQIQLNIWFGAAYPELGKMTLCVRCKKAYKDNEMSP